MVYKINWFMIWLFLIIVILALNSTTVNSQTQKVDCFLIDNVRVFQDGKFLEEIDVLVKGAEIVGIDEEINSKCPRIDGEGKTLLPGLVNAHVHAWIPYHLQNAVQFGVFTLQDMHSLNETTAQLKLMSNQTGFAKLFGAGYAATVAGGHGTQFGYEVPVIGGNRNCYEFVDDQVNAGVDHIKIIFEPAASTLSLAQIDSLIKRTHFHDKKAVVHISSADDALVVARLGADGLVHMWRDRQMTTTELKEIASSGTFIIPTLSVMEKAIAYLKEKGIDRRRMTTNEMLEEVKRIYDAGITLLAGTDPPNFGLDYGESLHHELELMSQSGIPSIEVLKSATSNPYQVYGYEFKGIKVGEEATFILVDGNPEKKISDTQNILIRWMKGIEIEKLNE